MKPHKWHKEIKAWADGAKIEFRTYANGKWGDWVIDNEPDWYVDNDWHYRIKPQPKEPQYLYVYKGCPLALSLEPIEQYGSNIVGKIKLEQE